MAMEVDISPIADLMKSEVYQLGHELGVLKDILESFQLMDCGKMVGLTRIKLGLHTRS